MIIKKRVSSFFNILNYIKLTILSLILCSYFSYASNNNIEFYRGNEKGVSANDSMGQLYIFGTLTESTCHIEMNSLYQAINMENIQLSNLQKVGDQGKPIPFQIALSDCLETETILSNTKGRTMWSSEQPGIKLKFIADTVPFYPQLAQVAGVNGIGLKISDHEGKTLALKEDSAPYFLQPGNMQLTFFVTPVRIAENINAGIYNSLISFELLYD
ncbi:TPA: fimbrial protein [Proteus mirabilis]|nr:type 1 fimbrial protein [Proteus mirabilis]HEK0447481.1 type 1 fimbrial protein [Proteus mirabilis]HEK2945491.1 type 1 fimbrial protein [Proteus mirabilis]